jgi:hypothetical protein
VPCSLAATVAGVSLLWRRGLGEDAVSTLRGHLTAAHPAAAVVDRCSPCCRTSAVAAEPFLVCPECGLWLLRCSTCRGVVAPSGWCEQCLDLRIEWPERIDLDVGGSCDVPVDILLASRSPVELISLTLRSGRSEVTADLRGSALHPGGRVSALLHLAFPDHGDFALRASVEFSWPLSASLLGVSQAPGVVRVRPSRHGHVVNVSGTGNLVAAGAGMGLFGNNEEAAPLGVSAARALAPLQPSAVGGEGIVSWRTRLIVPNMLDGGEPIELVSRIGLGVCLGRNRPPETVESLGGPCEAALRFPSSRDRARESSLGLSRAHWRLYAAGGAWWLEQLGQLPTTVHTPGSGNAQLCQGERSRLVPGCQLVVPGEGSAAPMVFALRHREVVGGHVLRSELVLAAGARA